MGATKKSPVSSNGSNGAHRRACPPRRVNGSNSLKFSRKPVEVRESGVHGRGVFATRAIRKGERIIEYAGRRITWATAKKMPDTDRENPNHTKFFELDDGKIIDPSVGGNESQWINHSCAPNCQTDEEKGRIYVVARRNLKPGEELSYDYCLEVEGPRTKKLERDFGCNCGATRCRGTMLEALE